MFDAALPGQGSRWVALTVVAAALATGCGGGQAPSEPDVLLAPATTGTSQGLSTPTAATTSYTLRSLPLPLGLGVPFLTVHRTINASGQVVGLAEQGFVIDAQDNALTYLSQDFTTTYAPFAIADSGAVAGAIMGQAFKGFAWTRDGGVEPFSISERMLGILTVFVADSGLVGGVGLRQQPDCGTFTFDPSTDTLNEYPDFCATSMNKAGVMVGVTRDNRVATLSPDGQVRIVDAMLRSGGRMFITDDNDIFLHLPEDVGELKAGAVMISGGRAMNIGRGAVRPPADAAQATELVTISSVSSKGHAIGTAGFFIDDVCMDPAGEPATIFWSAQTGTAVIEFENRITVANDVNDDGVVVGNAYLKFDGSAGFPKAFVWSFESGGSFLDTHVSNLPQDAELVEGFAVGDGGHILAFKTHPVAESRGWVLLTPQQ
jgi:hypothetical protein